MTRWKLGVSAIGRCNRITIAPPIRIGPAARPESRAIMYWRRSQASRCGIRARFASCSDSGDLAARRTDCLTHSRVSHSARNGTEPGTVGVPRATFSFVNFRRLCRPSRANLSIMRRSRSSPCHSLICICAEISAIWAAADRIRRRRHCSADSHHVRGRHYRAT
jgi:hypothetical protein